VAAQAESLGTGAVELETTGRKMMAIGVSVAFRDQGLVPEGERTEREWGDWGREGVVSGRGGAWQEEEDVRAGKGAGRERREEGKREASAREVGAEGSEKARTYERGERREEERWVVEGRGSERGHDGGGSERGGGGGRGDAGPGGWGDLWAAREEMRAREEARMDAIEAEFRQREQRRQHAVQVRPRQVRGGVVPEV